MAKLRNDTTFMDGTVVKDLIDSKPSFDDINDIPRVYLSGAHLPITKDNQTMKMSYKSKTLNFDCWITIKCQGTSSMAYDKKNFSIRLYEDETLTTKLKKDFKGWGPQYKFVWKANYIDLTHARNIVSARLWADCVRAREDFDQLPELLRTSPNLGAIDGFFIKLYYEGVYQGRYTWNIPKDPWMTNMDTTNEQHCLLCGENYESGCFRAEALIDETDWTDEIHDIVPQSILTRWNEVISFVMNSTDVDFKANLNNYIDVTSIIDYYLFHYVCCGLDALGKNQVYITYDGQKWYATSYDMDSTWGLYWDGASIVSPAYRMQQDYETGVHGTSNLLIDRLEKLFYQEIYDRFQVLKNGPLSLPHIISRFEDFMICDQDLIAEDYAVYPGIPGQSISNLQQIRKYASERIPYVTDCIDALNEPEPTAGKLYELPSTTTFNGTSDYIDTEIQLFDTRKDFTIVAFGKMDTVAQDNNTAIMHCMEESGNYPGLSLQYNAGYSGYVILGNAGFADYPINVNKVKFAITCKNGELMYFKIQRDKGIETYRALKCSYTTPVTKNLLLGCYQDSSGNKGRYWNGTLYNFVVYDAALTGAQINNILNSFVPPNAVLKDAYSPAGASFTNTVGIDWNTQEVYVTMDLSTCTGTNENILSIGNAINTWTSTNCVHFYYTKNNTTMIADANGANRSLEATVPASTVTIKLNSNGLYINDTLYDNTNLKSPTNIETIQIGSAEGATRSNASNYHIEIRAKS